MEDMTAFQSAQGNFVAWHQEAVQKISETIAIVNAMQDQNLQKTANINANIYEIDRKIGFVINACANPMVIFMLTSSFIAWWFSHSVGKRVIVLYCESNPYLSMRYTLKLISKSLQPRAISSSKTPRTGLRLLPFASPAYGHPSSKYPSFRISTIANGPLRPFMAASLCS